MTGEKAKPSFAAPKLHSRPANYIAIYGTRTELWYGISGKLWVSGVLQLLVSLSAHLPLHKEQGGDDGTGHPHNCTCIPDIQQLVDVAEPARSVVELQAQSTSGHLLQ